MREKLTINPYDYPDEFRYLFNGSSVYDSSCSKEATVIYIDKDHGYFLKSAPKGSLCKEAEMTRFLSTKGMAPEVISYFSDDKDWLLTLKARGADCTEVKYLEDPVKLCDTIAMLLRELHSVDHSGCPIDDRLADYIETAEKNYRSGYFDKSLFPDNWGYSTPDEAWNVIQNNKHLLKGDVLIHGDYCLPNIMLNDWKFSAFIDVGNGGIGDRHIDIFWGLWSLSHNLKTDKYSKRFIDAYGRSDVDIEMLKVIAAFEVFG